MHEPGICARIDGWIRAPGTWDGGEGNQANEERRQAKSLEAHGSFARMVADGQRTA